MDKSTTLFFRYISIAEYPYQKFPYYCEGAFYLFHIQTAEKLYKLFEKELYRNYIWIEDVYLTGK